MREKTSRVAWLAVAAGLIALAAVGFWAVAVAGLPAERLREGKHPRPDKQAPWVHDPAPEGGLR